MYTWKKSGIYAIENLINGILYIGSTYNLSGRKGTHIHELRNNKHPNGHLQNAFNKYGEDNFEFKVLLYCEKDELLRYEQGLLDSYRAKGTLLYNIRVNAENNAGFTHSEETKRQISNTLIEKGIHKGKDNPMYGMSGDKNPFYGKTHSEETRKYLSEINTGKHISEEVKQILSVKCGGENSAGAKLTNEKVIEIRRLISEGVKVIEIAKRFNVCRRTISQIKNNRSWKHVK